MFDVTQGHMMGIFQGQMLKIDVLSLKIILKFNILSWNDDSKTLEQRSTGYNASNTLHNTNINNTQMHDI